MRYIQYHLGAYTQLKEHTVRRYNLHHLLRYHKASRHTIYRRVILHQANITLSLTEDVQINIPD